MLWLRGTGTDYGALSTQDVRVRLASLVIREKKKELLKKKKKGISSTGNRTLVSRVTGGDTDHYTIEDLLVHEDGRLLVHHS